MSLLAGDQTFSAYTGVGPSGSDGAYLAALPFIAQASGMATTLNAWVTPGTATQFQMGLYDGTLQLLAASPLVSVSAAGAVSFPISAPIIAGRAYQLALTANGTYQFGGDTTIPTRAFLSTNGSTLPYQLSGPNPSAYLSPAFFVDGDAQATLLSTSGTLQNIFDTATVITRALNRCRVKSTQITDELINTARDELYLVLVGLANGPTPLWAIDTQLLPFTAGQAGIIAPAGTVDVKNVNYRQMTAYQSGPSTYAPASPTQVTTVGITWKGPATPVQVLMGSQVLLSVTPNASAGQTTLFDLDGAVPASQWAVLAGNVSSVTFYGNLYEVPMYPYSRDEWSQLPNRAFAGTPRQFWFERAMSPVIHLWPVPQLSDQNQACLVVFRHRHIQDVGGLTQRIEVPKRWQPAIIDMLAEAMGRHPEVDANLLPSLQSYAAKSLAIAKGEERENAPMKIVPNVRGYTR